MVELKAFSRLKNMFGRLNPVSSFGLKKIKIKKDVVPKHKDLLERTIKKYSKFQYVILIAVYHLINTKNVTEEYLTVLTKDKRLVADLVKGNSNEVSVPTNVKSEAKKDNILLTCHNHYYGSIIPSKRDFKNSLIPKILFTVIVSEGNIGILINEFNSFEDDKLQLLKIDLNDYIDYVRFSFIVNNEFEIEELDNLNLDEDEYVIKYQCLFDKYVAKNNLKFVNEFNLRMKKYNLYILYIKLIGEDDV